MALIHRIRARLPNGKALLYNEIAQAYLETIDDYRKLRETNDTLADKKRWLARTRFEIQNRRTGVSTVNPGEKTTRETLIDGATLRDWVAEAMTSSCRKVDESDPALLHPPP